MGPMTFGQGVSVLTARLSLKVCNLGPNPRHKTAKPIILARIVFLPLKLRQTPLSIVLVEPFVADLTEQRQKLMPWVLHA